MNIKSHFWYRESTQEWVFEVEVSIPDSLFSTQRYTGKTKVEAIECFQELFAETLKENLELIKEVKD